MYSKGLIFFLVTIFFLSTFVTTSFSITLSEIGIGEIYILKEKEKKIRVKALDIRNKKIEVIFLEGASKGEVGLVYPDKLSVLSGDFLGGVFGGLLGNFSSYNQRIIFGRNVKKQEHLLVDVFFGTNRNLMKEKSSKKYFGTERADFTFGIASVSIPIREHKIGNLESPKVYKFEFVENPDKHIILNSVLTINSKNFYDLLKKEIPKTENDIFVFIHGFNVNFEDSIRRTAQLAYDLQFPGIPVAYSWPSQGALSPIAYTTDKNYSEWSYPHLKQFLIDLKEKANTEKIHVLAHSMGSQVLANALKEINENELTLSQVVLAAPDIDAKIFKENIAPFLTTGKAKRISMYTSSNDKALLISKEIQKGQRAGESGKEMLILEGIDTIDASTIDTSMLGHSYYGDEREVIFDLYHLIKNNQPPGLRNLDQIRRGGKIFWQLRK